MRIKTLIIKHLAAPARWVAAIALITAGGFLVSACGGHSGGTAPAAARPAATASPAASGLDLTQAAFAKAWAAYPDDQKDEVCAETHGRTHEWIKDTLAEGGGNSTLIDWDEAATWTVAQCAAEGR